MSARVVSGVDANGRLVARKRSRDAADAVRLVHEAEVLSAARHPGVVEFVSSEAIGDGIELVTLFVGTHSLDTIGPVSAERAAGLVAALAETVADLHDLGLVHGRIDPSHVLVGTGGRPILCGFAGGGRIGTTPPDASLAASGFSDPAATDDSSLSPDVDVFGLGSLLRALIVDQDSDLEPIPDHRFSFGRIRLPWNGYQRRALLTLADHATDEAPPRRLPARRLAADILDTMPTARLDDETRTRGLPSNNRLGPGPGIWWRRGAAIAVGLALALMTVVAVRSDRSFGVVSDAPAAMSSTADVRSTPSTTAAADTREGQIIVVGTQRFEAGVAGDRVVLGDWDCDGVPTPALLRPTTGALFVFEEWASEGNDLSVTPTRNVRGAVDVRARDRGDGCSTLVVVRDDGTEQVII